MPSVVGLRAFANHAPHRWLAASRRSKRAYDAPHPYMAVNRTLAAR